MRKIVLVAWHELTETVRSKTFLLGLVLTPIITIIAFLVPTLLINTLAPTRYVAIVDQTRAGDIAPALLDEIARSRALEDMKTLNLYLRAYVRPELKDGDRLDTAEIPLMFHKAGSLTRADAQAWLDAGGWDWAVEHIRPWLRAGAPTSPARPPWFLNIVPLPEKIDPRTDPADLAAQAAPYLEGRTTIRVADKQESLHALLIIPSLFSPAASDDPAAIGIGQDRVAQLWAEKTPDDDVEDLLEEALTHIAGITALNRPAQEAIGLQSITAPFDTRLIGREGTAASATLSDTLATNMPRILAAVLVMFLLGNLMLLMTNTMEEKSNRIIEVLLSSVTTNELLAGKLLGAAFIAVFQLFFNIIIIIGVLNNVNDGAVAILATNVIDVLLTSPILLWLLFYFITGYFIYAGLFVALGSLCENTKEMNSIAVPFTYFLMFLPVVVWFVAAEPNSALAKGLSYFPLTSPVMMMARITSDPGLFDILFTVLCQLGGIALVIWLSTRLFRAGALRAGGKPPQIKELWLAVRGQA